MKSEIKRAEVNLVKEQYSEHEFTPNRKDNYLPNKLVFANADFSRVEQRLFEFFVNQINHGEIEPSYGIEVKIPISVINEYVETRQVMAVTKSMAQKVITLSDLSKSQLEFTHLPVFTSIDYNINKSGFLVFRSNPKLSPYLAELGKAYTKYEFKTIQSLKSSYSVILYKLLAAHIGQHRYSFVYSIAELKKLFQIDPKKYQHLKGFKVRILDIAQRECAIALNPIIFEYENEGNKQRNITHIRFNVITAVSLSRIEKQEFNEAIGLNPKFVYAKVQEIIAKDYNFRDAHKNTILQNEEFLSKFITLHIEFSNGLHPKVKNRSAYILACLGLVKKKQSV